MSSAVAHLQPYIYTILSGPDVDLSRISAKRVRRQLVDGRSADAEFVRDNKDAVDALIADVFQRVSAERGFVPEVADEDEGEPPAAEEEGASEPVYEGEEGQGDGGSSPDPEPVPKKKKGRPPKTQKDDEAYARQLQAELNPPARASRSGSGGAPSKGGRKRKTKSSETVEDASDDDDLGEDDAEAGVPPPKKKRRRAGAANGGAGDGEDGKEKKKRGGGGFQKPYQLSEPLVAVLNETVLPRGQVVKALWGYIKSHNLQNPSDKREILCDDKLRALFKLDKVTMFSMNKELSKHLIDPLANA